MNGGYVHEFILDSLDKAFREADVAVSRQVPSRPGRQTGYVDLVAHVGGETLAIEAEMSPRRVLQDLQKAEELGAHLWIVVANRRVVSSVRKHLRQLRTGKKMDVCVLTLGQALQRVRNCFPISRMSMVNEKTNTGRPRRASDRPEAPSYGNQVEQCDLLRLDNLCPDYGDSDA